MTEEELARQLKISTGNLARIERGEARPSLEVMDALMEVLR